MSLPNQSADNSTVTNGEHHSIQQKPPKIEIDK